MELKEYKQYLKDNNIELREYFYLREEMNLMARYTINKIGYPESVALNLVQALYAMKAYEKLIGKYDWAKREVKWHKDRINKIKEEYLKIKNEM